jgi:AcrR family transcriptional regulator
MFDASVRSLASDGWASLTLARVARELGMSARPVRNRARNRSHLAALSWSARCAPDLISAVERCMAGLAQSRESGDGAELCSALVDMVRRTPVRDAAAELLVCAHFDEEVATAVDAELGMRVRALITPSDSLTPDDAARAAYVLSMALGLMIFARYPRAHDSGITEAMPAWVSAFDSDAPGQPLPERNASHIDVSPVLAADDPALDALLSATLELIGRHGFDGVTVSQIAQAAGYTEGLVFHRYSSKIDMFTDATRRQNEADWRVNHEFAHALEQDFGPGIAEAVLIKEAQKPGRDVGRGRALEQVRMAWHDPDLGTASIEQMDTFRANLLLAPGWDVIESEGDFSINIAVSLGMYALPLLAPDCFDLPWDVVTVPLFASFAARATA